MPEIRRVTYEKKGKHLAIGGLIKNNDIYLVEGKTFISQLETLSHELGHHLGNTLSFKNGGVLTPDQVKATNPQLSLGEKLIILIYGNTVIKNNKTVQRYFERIFFKLMEIYTKNQMDFSIFNFHFNVPQEDINQLAKNGPNENGLMFDQNDNPILSANRQNRNDELPAYATSHAILWLLENSLKLKDQKLYNIKIKYNYSFEKTPHYRALRIVDRAYEKTGWIIPSLVDINQKK